MTTEQILKGSTLVELHEELSAFAKYHHNKGGQAAHRLIKAELVDKFASTPRNGSPEALLISEGYDKALKEVLSLLHSNFIP